MNGSRSAGRPSSLRTCRALQQYGDRSGGARAGRRPYAAPHRPTHHPPRCLDPVSTCCATSRRSPASPARRSSWWCTLRCGPRLFGVHRRCEGQSGKIRMAMTSAGSSPRDRQADPAHDRCRRGQRALRRRRVCAEGSDRRAGADDVRAHAGIDGPIRAASLRRRYAARSPSLPGIRPWPSPSGLRGERGDRHRRAREHACGIVERLNKEINAASTRRRRRASPTPAATCLRLARRVQKVLAEEIEKWAKVVTASGTAG